MRALREVVRGTLPSGPPRSGIWREKGTGDERLCRLSGFRVSAFVKWACEEQAPDPPDSYLQSAPRRQNYPEIQEHDDPVSAPAGWPGGGWQRRVQPRAAARRVAGTSHQRFAGEKYWKSRSTAPVPGAPLRPCCPVLWTTSLTAESRSWSPSTVSHHRFKQVFRKRPSMKAIEIEIVRAISSTSSSKSAAIPSLPLRHDYGPCFTFLL